MCVCVCVLVTQLCPTLCNSMDCSSPDSSVHRILQARKLEWVAISFSRGSSPPRDWTLASCIAVILYCLSHQGNLYLNYHLRIILPQGSANFVSRHQIPTLRFFLFSICCIARMPRRVSGAWKQNQQTLRAGLFTSSNLSIGLHWVARGDSKSLPKVVRQNPPHPHASRGQKDNPEPKSSQ